MRVRLSVDGTGDAAVNIEIEHHVAYSDRTRQLDWDKRLLLEAAARAFAALYPRDERWEPKP